MDVFELTRALIDIDSVNPNETAIGDWLYDYLRPLAERFGGSIEKIEVQPGRNNIWVHWGTPEVVLSTHMDTVPPFIPSKEDDEFIWGRGACDTHGLGAAMMKAAEKLLEEGVRGFGILYVIGEEVDGAGAHFANQDPPEGVRYLINGEPTSNLLALGSKGTLRLDLRAKGKNAHSAYPELGDSAIDKILDNVQALRNLELPVDDVLGACTMNVGVIRGGRAANIIADECVAEIAIRVVTDLQETKKLFLDALDDRVEPTIVTETPAVLLKAVEGFETTIVKYTTDIPKLSNWGQPLLLGPGTIHVAHTLEERVPKKEVAEAVDLYASLVKQLKTTKN